TTINHTKLDNKALTSELLLREIIKILKKEFKGKLFDKQYEEIKAIVGDRQLVLGQTFYNACIHNNVDIDGLSDRVFRSYKWSPILAKQEFQTKLQAFIYPFVNSANDICEASGIEKSRFSRLQKGELKDLYAHEVYGLAKSCGIKPSQLFHFFYGDGERPIVGL